MIVLPWILPKRLYDAIMVIFECDLNRDTAIRTLAQLPLISWLINTLLTAYQEVAHSRQQLCQISESVRRLETNREEVKVLLRELNQQVLM